MDVVKEFSDYKAKSDAKIAKLAPETIKFWYEVLDNGLTEFWAKRMSYKELQALERQAFKVIDVLAIDYVAEKGKIHAETKVGKHLTLSQCEEFWYEMMMAADHHLCLGTEGVTAHDFDRSEELWSNYGQVPSYLFTPGMDDDLFHSSR